MKEMNINTDSLSNVVDSLSDVSGQINSAKQSIDEANGMSSIKANTPIDAASSNTTAAMDKLSGSISSIINSQKKALLALGVDDDGNDNGFEFGFGDAESLYFNEDGSIDYTKLAEMYDDDEGYFQNLHLNNFAEVIPKLTSFVKKYKEEKFPQLIVKHADTAFFCVNRDKYGTLEYEQAQNYYRDAVALDYMLSKEDNTTNYGSAITRYTSHDEINTELTKIWDNYDYQGLGIEESAWNREGITNLDRVGLIISHGDNTNDSKDTTANNINLYNDLTMGNAMESSYFFDGERKTVKGLFKELASNPFGVDWSLLNASAGNLKQQAEYVTNIELTLEDCVNVDGTLKDTDVINDKMKNLMRNLSKPNSSRFDYLDKTFVGDSKGEEKWLETLLDLGYISNDDASKIDLTDDKNEYTSAYKNGVGSSKFLMTLYTSSSDDDNKLAKFLNEYYINYGYSEEEIKTFIDIVETDLKYNFDSLKIEDQAVGDAYNVIGDWATKNYNINYIQEQSFLYYLSKIDTSKLTDEDLEKAKKDLGIKNYYLVDEDYVRGYAVILKNDSNSELCSKYKDALISEKTHNQAKNDAKWKINASGLTADDPNHLTNVGSLMFMGGTGVYYGTGNLGRGLWNFFAADGKPSPFQLEQIYLRSYLTEDYSAFESFNKQDFENMSSLNYDGIDGLTVEQINACKEQGIPRYQVLYHMGKLSEEDAKKYDLYINTGVADCEFYQQLNECSKYMKKGANFTLNTAQSATESGIPILLDALSPVKGAGLALLFASTTGNSREEALQSGEVDEVGAWIYGLLKGVTTTSIESLGGMLSPKYLNQLPPSMRKMVAEEIFEELLQYPFDLGLDVGFKQREMPTLIDVGSEVVETVVMTALITPLLSGAGSKIARSKRNPHTICNDFSYNASYDEIQQFVKSDGSYDQAAFLKFLNDENRISSNKGKFNSIKMTKDGFSCETKDGKIEMYDFYGNKKANTPTENHYATKANMIKRADMIRKNSESSISSDEMNNETKATKENPYAKKTETLEYAVFDDEITDIENVKNETSTESSIPDGMHVATEADLIRKDKSEKISFPEPSKTVKKADEFIRTLDDALLDNEISNIEKSKTGTPKESSIPEGMHAATEADLIRKNKDKSGRNPLQETIADIVDTSKKINDIFKGAGLNRYKITYDGTSYRCDDGYTYEFDKNGNLVKMTRGSSNVNLLDPMKLPKSSEEAITAINKVKEKTVTTPKTSGTKSSPNTKIVDIFTGAGLNRYKTIYDGTCYRCDDGYTYEFDKNGNLVKMTRGSSNVNLLDPMKLPKSSEEAITAINKVKEKIKLASKTDAKKISDIFKGAGLNRYKTTYDGTCYRCDDGYTYEFDKNGNLVKMTKGSSNVNLLDRSNLPRNSQEAIMAIKEIKSREINQTINNILKSVGEENVSKHDSKYYYLRTGKKYTYMFDYKGNLIGILNKDSENLLSTTDLPKTPQEAINVIKQVQNNDTKIEKKENNTEGSVTKITGETNTGESGNKKYTNKDALLTSKEIDEKIKISLNGIKAKLTKKNSNGFEYAESDKYTYKFDRMGNIVSMSKTGDSSNLLDPTKLPTNPEEAKQAINTIKEENTTKSATESAAKTVTETTTETATESTSNKKGIAAAIIGAVLTTILVTVPFIGNIIGGNKDEFYLKLLGKEEISLFINNEFEEPGYEAYDPKDGDLHDAVQIVNSINNKKIGDYIVTYTVTNSRGETLEKVRKVKVVRKGSAHENSGSMGVDENVTSNITEITLNDFDGQIEKGKVYNGIKMNTTQLMNEYINKFRLEKSLVYAISLTSIVSSDNRYSDIASCNGNYLNTEASAIIMTNGTIERVYNSSNNCFANYGVFYFTKNRLNHAVVNSETINNTIISSQTRNTFVYQDVIVDNGVIVNNSETMTMNNAICQNGTNSIKLFTFDDYVKYSDIGQLMIDNGCQTGILLTDGDTILYKSQYSSTINIQRGTDNLTDSIIFFYQKN